MTEVYIVCESGGDHHKNLAVFVKLEAAEAYAEKQAKRYRMSKGKVFFKGRVVAIWSDADEDSVIIERWEILQ